MTRGAKILMLADTRNHSNQDGNREGRMNYEVQNNHDMESTQGGRRMENEMRGGYGQMESNRGGRMRNETRDEMESNYEMESRRRDRRGRFTGDMEMNRTYEYGPKNGGYAETRYEPRNDDMEYRFRDNRRQEYGDMEMNNNRWMPPYYGEEANRGGQEMNDRRYPIGFESHLNREEMQSDASVKPYNEMERMSGQKPRMGKGETKSMPRFSPAMAEEWTSRMKNTDESKGPHWSLDQARQIIKQKDLLCDPYKFWAVMNAIYSDHAKTIQKHGVHNQDFYVDLTMDWLMDEDAVDDKPAAYYTHVVKH